MSNDFMGLLLVPLSFCLSSSMISSLVLSWSMSLTISLSISSFSSRSALLLVPIIASSLFRYLCIFIIQLVPTTLGSSSGSCPFFTPLTLLEKCCARNVCGLQRALLKMPTNIGNKSTQVQHQLYNMRILIFCLLGVLGISASCPAFTFGTSTCLPCSTSCFTCSSPTVCSSCASGFFLSVNQTCSKCPSNCNICSQATVCTACSQPYILVNNSCLLCTVPFAASCSSLSTVSTCKSGFYSYTSYCGSCLLQCSSCINSTYCTGCAQGYFLQYQNSVCSPCSGCAACSGSASNCTSCVAGSKLVSNTCVSVTCSIINCAYCSDTNICANCNLYYYLSSNTCILGSSVLCQKGALGSWPNQCKACGTNSYVGATVDSNLYCIPYSSLSSGAISQSYYYMYNDYLSLFPATTIANSCNDESYIVAPSDILLNIDNYYTLTLTLKGYSLSASSSMVLVLTDGTSSQSQDVSLKGTCQSVVISINSTSLNSNPLTIRFLNGSSFGLIELLIVNKLCTAGCVKCLNAELCTQCALPNYLLSYSCVSDCGNYYRLNHSGILSCVISCPDGFYPLLNSSNYCLPCTLPCQTCLNATLCLSCAPLAGVTYYYQSLNNSCLTSCPDQYFKNGPNCVPCLSPCRRCTDHITCLSCVEGYWNGTTCSVSCPNGTYANPLLNSCEQCLGCLTCVNSSSICTSCLSGLILFDGSCLSHCSSGYYLLGTACVKCIPPCLTCQSNTTCLSCSIGYLTGTSCLNTCPSGAYPDLSTQTCTSCYSSCLSCISPTECTSCQANYCLQLSSCVAASSGCLDSYYSITVSGMCSCVPCSYPCKLCSNQTSCLSCLAGYLQGSTCVSTCPSSYYANASLQECILCSSTFVNCFQCSQSYCSTCQPGFLYNQFSTTSNFCVSTCPTLLYNASNICANCVPPCLECSSSSVCITCIDGYALGNNSCVTECSSGQYLSTATSSPLCLSCVSPCRTCSNSTMCLSCVRVNVINSQSYLLNGSCSSCPSGYYPSLVTLQCQKCLYPCSTCTSQSSCTSCAAGFYNPSTHSCSQCSQGTYANTTTMACEPCKTSCISCTNSTDCSRCTNGTLSKGIECLTAGECSSYSGFYSSAVTSTCLSCVSPCSSCSNQTTCLSCLQGYMFFNGSCIVVCPSGYFNNISISTCTKCPSQCNTCISLVSCLSCQPGFVFYKNQLTCLLTCPSRTYLVGSQCLDCKYPCLECTSEAKCLSCQSGILLQSNMSCITSCPSQFYSTNDTCKSCDPSCLQCSSTPVNCTSCPQGKYLYNNTCQNSCPDTYFGDNQVSSCFSCLAPCLYCSDQIACIKCSDEYSFIVALNQCTLVCPPSYFSVLNNDTSLSASKNLCLSCLPQCMTCSHPYSCDLCINGVQFNGTCISECPERMFPQNGVCNNCSLPCYNCSSTTVCKSCPVNSGYLLVASSQCFSASTCPLGYFFQPSGTSCEVNCPPSFYMDSVSRKCLKECPLDTFKGLDANCYEGCPAGSFGNSTYFCQNCSGACPDPLLRFTISSDLVGDSLTLTISFTTTPIFSMALNESYLLLEPSIPFSIKEVTAKMVILQLLPVESIQITTLSVRFLSPFSLFSSQLPLQSPRQTMAFQGYNNYNMPVPNLYTIATALAVISTAVCVWRGYMGLDFVQSLFLFNLVNIHYPPHLSSFLQGFRISHFYFPILEVAAPVVEKFKTAVSNMSLLGNCVHGIALIGVALVVTVIVLIFEGVRSHRVIPDGSPKQPQSSSFWERINVLSLLKTSLIMKMVYLFFTYITLFSICQLLNFASPAPTLISQISKYVSPLVLTLLVFFPCLLLILLEKKPFLYTILLIRKLLVSVCIVVAMKYPIYIFGFMAVVSLSTFVLLLTHKTCKWRVESLTNLVGQGINLLLACAFSVLTFYDQGTQTAKKISIAYVIIIGACLGILMYTSINAVMIVSWIIWKMTGRDLIAEWSKVEENKDVVSQPHSEDDSSLDIKLNRSKSKLGTHLVQQDIILEVPKHEEESARGEQETNKEFRVYSDNGSAHSHDEPLDKPPEMLIKVVNQFDDFQPVD